MAKQFDRVYVRTPFPQLYEDQDPSRFWFLPRHSRLNLQERCVDAFRWWAEEPESGHISHKTCFWMSGVNSPIGCLTDRFLFDSGLDSVDFSMPIMHNWMLPAIDLMRRLGINSSGNRGKRVCIVKRPTLRNEWYCPARNPRIEYLQEIIDYLHEDYVFISVADLRDGEEWLDGELSGIQFEFHAGEIDVWTLLGLVSLADLSICTQSFFVPFALATGSTCFCVYGGFGGPWRYISRWMDTSRFGYAAPDPFCDCGKMEHRCHKEIPQLMDTFKNFHDRMLAL